MGLTLTEFLVHAEQSGGLPGCLARNRIDGPGSSLDLREFQESFWSLPADDVLNEPTGAAAWSASLPRTVGITIDAGVYVEASPLPAGKIGIESVDYGTRYVVESDNVPYSPSHWLARIVATFGLDGVSFRLHNLAPGLKSAGLGGSATASTAVCLLANHLAGSPFSGDQIIAIASLIEQDMGVSITGTQEQANVVYGGVVDYVWFPWGIPGTTSGFGSSFRMTLLPQSEYSELESRIAIFHSGAERASSDVNSVWRSRLSDPEGHRLIRRQLRPAYDFREGIRTHNWLAVQDSIREYRTLRTELAPQYMTNACWEIQGQCERFGAESFPLGAGGGGAVLAYSADPVVLPQLETVLAPVFRPVAVRLQPRGHEFKNVDAQPEKWLPSDHEAGLNEAT